MSGIRDLWSKRPSWLLPLVLGLLGAVVAERGGLGVVARVLRSLWPFFLAYAAYWWIRRWWRRLKGASPSSLNKPLGPKGGAEVIQICAKCGHQIIDAKHECS